jgi:hypothetical protein
MSEEKVISNEIPMQAVSDDHNITAVHDIEDSEVGKPGLHIKDEAGNVAVTALATDSASLEDRKAVLRKIDLYILPMMCVTYGKYIRHHTTILYQNSDLSNRSSILRQDSIIILFGFWSHPR